MHDDDKDQTPAAGGAAAEAAEEEAGSEAESDSDEDPWLKNASFKTVVNSKSKRAQSSSMWNTVRMLAPDHPKKLKNDFTHVCVEDNCGTFMKLVKPPGKGNFGTTKVVAHAKKCHPTGSGKSYIEADNKRQVNTGRSPFRCFYFLSFFCFVFSRGIARRTISTLTSMLMTKKAAAAAVAAMAVAALVAVVVFLGATVVVVATVGVGVVGVAAHSSNQRRSKTRSPLKLGGWCTRDRGFRWGPSQIHSSRRCCRLLVMAPVELPS